MDKFEEVLNKAQSGDGQAMEKLLEEYIPLIDSLVLRANKGIDKEDFGQIAYEELEKREKENIKND